MFTSIVKLGSRRRETLPLEIRMMASEQRPLPKARHILCIRSKVPIKRRFLQLPRELRDVIYRYALIEPRKWDKRHQPDCFYYDPTAERETPPFRVIAKCLQRPFQDIPKETLQCHQTCVRRKALGLISVNKQIRDEASPIFWSNTTFCVEHDDVPINDILESCPEPARSKVQKIALMDTFYPRLYWFWKTETLAGVLETLLSLANLTDLELRHGGVTGHYEGISKLPSLRRVSFTSCETLRSRTRQFGPTDYFPELFVGLTLSCDLPVCNGRGWKHSRCRRWPDADCHERYMVLLRLSLKMFAAADRRIGHPRRDWTEDVRDEVRRIQPCQRDHAPYTMPLKLADGREHDIQIWGLPMNHPAGISQYKRDIARAAINERQKRDRCARDARAVTAAIPDEDGEYYYAGGRKARHHRHMSMKAEKRLENDEVEKRERKVIEALHEATRENGARKQAAKQRARSEKEVQTQKKAARKRPNR